MKLFFICPQQTGRSFLPGHSRGWLSTSHLVWPAFIAIGLVFTGCSRAKNSAPPPPPPEAVAQAQKDHMPVYTPVASNPSMAVAASNGEPDLAELNRAMLRWLMRNRRKPANFEDFAATAGVVIPPAPAGKKYVIAKDMHIQLANK